MKTTKTKHRHEDYVVGLLSGRVELVKVMTADGPKIVKDFKPFKLNPYPTITQIKQERHDKFSEDQIMVYEGLRPRRYRLDTEIFIKTKEEKLKLNRLKKEHNDILRHAGFNPNTRLNLTEPQRLIK